MIMPVKNAVRKCSLNFFVFCTVFQGLKGAPHLKVLSLPLASAVGPGP
jgi:hypothetical protein